MPRTAARFTQADLARALRATRDAGVIADVVIRPDGSIAIQPRSEAPAQESAAVPADLCKVPRRFGEA